MSNIVVELHALSDMNTALRKFQENGEEALSGAERAIETEMSRLQKVEQQCSAEVARCRAAYYSCRAQRDEDGHPPPCSGERQAWQIAEQALKEAQEQIGRFSDHADRYRREADRFRRTLDEVVPKARANLEKHIQAGLRYAQTNPENVRLLPGEGTHGAMYRRARGEFFRRGARRELQNEPRELQGWMLQEVNRSGYFRSPYRGSGTGTTAYHTGHYVSGIDIPENLRWELSQDNLLRSRRDRLYRGALP